MIRPLQQFQTFHLHGLSRRSLLPESILFLTRQKYDYRRSLRRKNLRRITWIPRIFRGREETSLAACSACCSAPCCSRTSFRRTPSPYLLRMTRRCTRLRRRNSRLLQRSQSGSFLDGESTHF